MIIAIVKIEQNKILTSSIRIIKLTHGYSFRRNQTDLLDSTSSIRII